MSNNGNVPAVKIVSPRTRVRASGPILILAVLFVAATFLAWYFTWFGRGLSNDDISRYLADVKNPRHVQHALLQIQERLERGDTSVKQWYPQIVELSRNDETEFRLTVAWLMGFDNHSDEFHQTLLHLLQDQQPIVRRNAALALVRFNDQSGHSELLAFLKPYEVVAPTDGTLVSTLREGSDVARGSLLGRLDAGTNVYEVRSPLPGRINTITRQNGSHVKTGDELLTLNSDEASIWEALRAIALIGKSEDVELVKSYAERGSSERIKQQAALTIQSINSRANSSSHTQ